MTKPNEKNEVNSFEKLRDQEAEKYVEHCRDNQHAVYGIAHAYCLADFKAGWDTRDKIAKEREAKLVEALEFYKGVHVNHWAIDFADLPRVVTEALADHKRMMEGEDE